MGTPVRGEIHLFLFSKKKGSEGKVIDHNQLSAIKRSKRKRIGGRTIGCITV